MILADVFVPSIDKTYNCSLDESASIGMVVEELVEMVERSEQAPFVGNREHVQLISKPTNQTLPKDNTLKECAVKSGITLILI